MKRLLIFFWAICLLFPGFVFANSYPDYIGYVNDFAHVLSPDYISALNSKLHEFNKRTTNQIAVVTVDTTSPEVIEEYSIHLADKWKVGQKGKDNGIILLFAMKDHKMRIEVGRGLEGDLTDITSKHIQHDLIAPAFKQNNYEQGITQGVDAVITTVTHGTLDPNSLNSTTSPPHGSSQIAGIFPYLPIVIFIIVILLIIAFSPKTKLGGRGSWGVTTFWGEGGASTDSGQSDSFGGGGFSGGGSSDSW